MEVLEAGVVGWGLVSDQLKCLIDILCVSL